MLDFTAPGDAVEREREPLFSLNGKTYTIPTQMTVPEMYGFLHMRRTQGADAAVSWALEHALGDEGYFALLQAPPGTVSDQAFVDLTNLVTARFLGLAATVPGPKDESTSPAGASESAAAEREPSDEEVWGSATGSLSD